MPGLYLTGRSGGDVELRRLDDPWCVARWGCECWMGSPADDYADLRVEWSHHRPAVFYVAACGRLHVFDLMEDEGGPMREWEVELGKGTAFAITKGPRNLGRATLAKVEIGSVEVRDLGSELVEEKKTLSEDNELEWMLSFVG